MQSPYVECPVYETEHFKLRLVSLTDAIDLLECYSDSKSQKLFNADNCLSDFCYYTVEEMHACIKMWIYSYKTEQFIRFAIIDSQNEKAIGTIEIFGGDAVNDYTGVLRVDIASKYETEQYIRELLTVSNRYFHNLFPVKNIITKAIPAAGERIKALINCGFQKYDDSSLDKPRMDFYIHTA